MCRIHRNGLKFWHFLSLCDFISTTDGHMTFWGLKAATKILPKCRLMDYESYNFHSIKVFLFCFFPWLHGSFCIESAPSERLGNVCFFCFFSQSSLFCNERAGISPFYLKRGHPILFVFPLFFFSYDYSILISHVSSIGFLSLNSCLLLLSLVSLN